MIKVIIKFINSKDNGVILPILNLNSYKISGPTIFGRMSNQELLDLFTGLGYEPHIIDARSDTDIYANRNNFRLPIVQKTQDVILKSLK